MSKQKLLKSLLEKGFSKDIVEAFKNVERKDFVPSSYKYFAYKDRPLPIGDNATISQPYTIAFMFDLLEINDGQKILEIGSGSGYVLALLSEMSPSSQIIGLEINCDLVKKSRIALNNYQNVEVLNVDGSIGYSDKQPYDRIIVSAAYQKEPLHLLDQLNEGGILVSPVKNSIIKYVKKESKVDKDEYYGFAFVPIL